MSANRISPLFGSSFGTLLRRYREAAGLTQEALAARAGLSARGISDLERGARQSPRRETVNLLADALALPPHTRALLQAAARPALAIGQQERQGAGALPPNNLAAQITPLIGREREARLVIEALGRADARLLTLTGPGGVGKSRLASQVAEDALERFEDGVYVVMLAALRDPALASQAIAEAIGLRVSASEPLPEQVRAYLRDRQMLLVLDNFEHLLAAAPEVTALLTSCPRLKALVTSREPLKIAGEREMVVAPLDEVAALDLFVERARAAKSDFDPAPDDRKIIAAICGQVDRLPLALELAAGWMRVLPLPTLLERLDSRLALLSHGRRDAPKRQRTLRDTIAWSERLLEPGERRLFQRLAIFAGGWSLEAAEAICGEGSHPGEAPPDERRVLDGLARLVEKSLALTVASPEGTRFTMLETIREFARERLEASGEADEIARRHAEYFARLAAEMGWIGPRQDERDRRLERDLPNIRAALAWAQTRREPEIGLRLAAPIGRWWYTRGAFDEAESWLRALLALDEATPERAAPASLRSTALYALILLTLDRRNYNEAEAMAREGLEFARRHGDAGRAGNMLAELGHVAEARGDLDAAMTYFEEALAQYEQGGARGEGAAVGRTLSSLGNLARAKGEYARARDYLARSLAWARARDFSFAIASGLVSLGHVAVEQSDYPRAATLYREALGMYQTLRNPASLAWCLEGVAATVANNAEAVARLAGAVASLRVAAGAAESAEWSAFARVCEASRQAVGEEAYTSAFERGAALPPERAIADALTALGEEARLPGSEPLS